jgi:hypothetical protein
MALLNLEIELQNLDRVDGCKLLMSCGRLTGHAIILKMVSRVDKVGLWMLTIAIIRSGLFSMMRNRVRNSPRLREHFDDEAASRSCDYEEIPRQRKNTNMQGRIGERKSYLLASASNQCARTTPKNGRKGY